MKAEMRKISVDYKRREGSPLFKKFHMFNSGLAPIGRYEENLDALRRIRPESIRIDLFLGDREQEFGDVIDGTPENPVFHFEKLDKLAKLLLREKIKPYWCWCYVPLPLQPPGGTFKDGPSDFKKFGDFLEKLSGHYRETKILLGWQEVFNEADCFDHLYAGTFADYLQMYEYGAPALKRGDWQAAVGGPAEAFQEPEERVKENLEGFIRLVRERNLPLDFFSYHSYGYEKKEYLERTAYVQNLLRGKKQFAHTELHMNELNVLPPPWEYGKTALTNETVVPIILDCIQELLEIHDLTAVHWAQLLNSGVDELSLVSLDGIYYPAFYVFELYNRMPVGRCPIRFDAEDCGIKGMASASEEGCAALFWNAGGQKEQADFFIEGLTGTDIDLYVCDSAFYKTAKTTARMPLLLREQIPVKEGKAAFSLALEPCEMVYAECLKTKEGSSAISSPEKKNNFIYGRQFYLFEDRGDNDSYSCMEPRYDTFYFGTGSKKRRLLRSGIILHAYPEKIYFSLHSNRAKEAKKKLSIHVKGANREQTLSWGELEEGISMAGFQGEVLLTVELAGAQSGLWVEIGMSAKPYGKKRIFFENEIS